MEDARSRARRLARESLERGDTTGWFERLYATAQGDAQAIPWVDAGPGRNFVEWARREQPPGSGKRALTVGCGLGDNAEELARLGFNVVAFDIAPTAIEWCRTRFPGSRVRYVVADLLAAPLAWDGAFDFVLEAFTVQVLTGDLRRQAIERIARFVAPGGTLLVIARGREPDDDPGSMPWPLTRAELELFAGGGLTLVRFEDYLDRHNDPPARRFRVEFRR